MVSLVLVERWDASLGDELGFVEEQALNDVVGDRHLFVGVGDGEPEVPVAGDGGGRVGGGEVGE